MNNGLKTITGTVAVEGGFVVKDLLYSCNEGFSLHPNDPIRSCQSNAVWSPYTELSCFAGKTVLLDLNLKIEQS